MHAVQFSLRSLYCLLRTVVWTLFCFTRSVFIVSCQCFVSWWQFCPLTGGFSGWWSWMLCSFFFDRCFACCALQYAQHWFVSRAKNYCTGDVCCESKVLFEVFLLFFFQCFFSWWQFCPLIGEFYVSDGWFFDFSLIIWGKPSSSQSQITSLKSKITNLKHNSLINGHNCHHKTKQRQEIKL